MTNRQDQYAIGIDIGGTGTKSGLVNHRGDILQRGDNLRTNEYEKVTDFVEDLYQVLSPSIESVGADKIRGIGIGAPNGNIYTGTIEYAPNLPWTGIIPLAQLVSDKFGLPCSLTNDANAAAVGEMMYGAARGMKDFIVITLGTGVGSGIFANGQLIYGHDGFAGELGHTIIRPGGRRHYSTGVYGSLETYASATGIALTAKELLQQTDKESLMRNHSEDEIDSKLVYDCAMQGDQMAKEVYRFTGQILGEVAS